MLGLIVQAFAAVQEHVEEPRAKTPDEGQKALQNSRRLELRTAEGKARIAAAHWKHGRRSKKFVEARAKIWAELRIIERRMKMDGLI